MITSSNDNRTYHSHNLSNGLKVLVIEDQDSEKAAASLTINCGHFDDPTSRQGLAHFLEHMLFLGSKNYPEPGDFSQFLSLNGGSCNAWTGTEHSSYFFEVFNTEFVEALEHFADMIQAPLILPSACEKERSAIDAEFKLKLKDDSRRIYQVHKETCNSVHPFAKFSVGNHQTLTSESKNISDEIRNFYTEHYQAQNMTLVVSSRTPCELMIVKIKQLFESIPGNAEQPKPRIECPLYLEEHMKQSIYIEPHKYMQKLIISFALPCIDKFYRDKTVSFIAHLIGYEGVGSLYSLLKKEGWINSLSAGGGINGSNFKDFNISINLTDEGKNYKKTIVEYLFFYLNLLSEADTAELTALYQDKKALMTMAFNNQEKSRVLDWVNNLSVNLHHYPDEYVIYGDYIMEGFERKLFDSVLALLNANNMRLVHIHPDVPTNKQAKWYETPFSVETLSQAWIDSLVKSTAGEKNISLPAINPYLKKPEVLHDVVFEHKTPEKRFDSDTFEFWYKQDTTFRVAKGHIYLTLDSQLTVESHEKMAMTRLFADLFMDKVAEMFYPAELAGINYQLSAHQGGLTLHSWGLSGNQIDLLSELLDALLTVKFDSIRFYEYQKQLIRHWQNGNQNKPVSLLFSELSASLLPWNPTPMQLASSIKQVSFEAFCQFSQRLFNEIHCKTLMHGNWLPHEADKCIHLLKNKFRGRAKLNSLKRPIKTIKQPQQQLHNVAHSDHAMVCYFQAQSDSISERVRLMAINHIISQDYFHEMRTEKQLGYLVGSGFAPLNTRAGIAFYIQSPEIPEHMLIKHNHAFLTQYHEKISAMSEQEWSQTKEALIMQILDKDKNLRLKSQRFWLSISNNDGQFDIPDKLKIALMQLSKTQLASYTRKLFSNNSVRLELITREHCPKQAKDLENIKQALTH